jgi:hypothetical protein
LALQSNLPVSWFETSDVGLYQKEQNPVCLRLDIGQEFAAIHVERACLALTLVIALISQSPTALDAAVAL